MASPNTPGPWYVSVGQRLVHSGHSVDFPLIDWLIDCLFKWGTLLMMSLDRGVHNSHDPSFRTFSRRSSKAKEFSLCGKVSRHITPGWDRILYWLLFSWSRWTKPIIHMSLEKPKLGQRFKNAREYFLFSRMKFRSFTSLRGKSALHWSNRWSNWDRKRILLLKRTRR